MDRQAWYDAIVFVLKKILEISSNQTIGTKRLIIVKLNIYTNTKQFQQSMENIKHRPDP